MFMCACAAHAQGWETLQDAPFTSRHNDVYFVSPDTGWVVSGAAEIYRTVDGGASWDLQFSKSATHLRSVGFLDSRRGFAGNVGSGEFGTTDPNVLYQTYDGGSTWSPVSAFHGQAPLGLCGMNVVNDSTIVAVGRVRGPSFFVRTTDAGQTWRSKNMSEYAAGLIDVYFTHPDTGFAVGLTNVDHSKSSGIVLATTDGGETWETRFTTSRTGEWCWKLSFPSRRVGYASLQRNSGSPVNFLKTVDGGITWEEKLFSTSHYFVQGIGFLSENEGWIGGNSDLPAYETRDSGETWTAVNIGSRLNRFRFLGDSLGYAVGRTVHKLTRSSSLRTKPEDEIPPRFSVAAVYPNPSRGRSTLIYELGRTDLVRIAVYDARGGLVEEILHQAQSTGRHEVVWDGSNHAAGVYFWVIRIGDIVVSRPALLLP